MRALLNVGAQAQRGASTTGADVAKAKAAAPRDIEIHDTVLIAASFCMFNRYVDGLGTWVWREGEVHGDRGKMAHEGMAPYVPSKESLDADPRTHGSSSVIIMLPFIHGIAWFPFPLLKG